MSETECPFCDSEVVQNSSSNELGTQATYWTECTECNAVKPENGEWGKMTDVITLSGRSDDLIEVEGAVQKELYANYGEPTRVHIGPWAFRVVYNTNGEWEITPISVPAGESMMLWGVGGHPNYKDYTQVVTFDADPDTDYDVTKA